MSITPRMSRDGVTLYQGDCLEILPLLDDGIAAVITDPPYIIGSMSTGDMRSKTGSWADMMNSALWFTTWYRIASTKLRSDGSLWTFCNWRTIPVLMRAAHDANMPTTSVLVWDKVRIGPGGMQGLRPRYELVAVMGKPAFAIEDRSLSDIWVEPSPIVKPSGHPAEKPVAIMRRILSALNLPKDSVVVDPFAGSGTLGDAARSLGLRCVLIEADEKWCQVIEQRMSQSMLSGLDV